MGPEVPQGFDVFGNLAGVLVGALWDSHRQVMGHCAGSQRATLMSADLGMFELTCRILLALLEQLDHLLEPERLRRHSPGEGMPVAKRVFLVPQS